MAEPSMDGVAPDPRATPAAAGERSVLLLLGVEVTGLRSEVLSALEFMDRSHRVRLELREIAVAVGMSPRRLQEVFHAAVADTPMGVLRRIRMLHARRRLLDPAERRSIRQIALEAQITHLGRFSQRYAATFGEVPSSTIARFRDQRHIRSVPTPRGEGGHFDVRTMEHRTN